MTDHPSDQNLQPRPRHTASDGAQKWVALLAAPVFFLIAGTLANSGFETVSTVFALLAMAMPPIFILLVIRDWIRLIRTGRRRRTAPDTAPRG